MLRRSLIFITSSRSFSGSFSPATFSFKSRKALDMTSYDMVPLVGRYRYKDMNGRPLQSSSRPCNPTLWLMEIGSRLAAVHRRVLKQVWPVQSLRAYTSRRTQLRDPAAAHPPCNTP